MPRSISQHFWTGWRSWGKLTFIMDYERKLIDL